MSPSINRHFNLHQVTLQNEFQCPRLNLAADAHMDIVGIELGLLVMVPVLRLLKLLRRFEQLGGWKWGDSHWKSISQNHGLTPHFLDYWCWSVLFGHGKADGDVTGWGPGGETMTNLQPCSPKLWQHGMEFGRVVPKSADLIRVGESRHMFV